MYVHLKIEILCFVIASTMVHFSSFACHTASPSVIQMQSGQAGDKDNNNSSHLLGYLEPVWWSSANAFGVLYFCT